MRTEQEIRDKMNELKRILENYTEPVANRDLELVLQHMQTERNALRWVLNEA